MILLDTNVLSELLKIRPDPQVVSRLEQVPIARRSTASICVMELRYGSALRADFATFWQRIEKRLLEGLTILPVGDREARRAGDILAALRRSGRPCGIEDVLIAACALSHDATLVTRNVRHLEQIEGLRVENWFVPS